MAATTSLTSEPRKRTRKARSSTELQTVPAPTLSAGVMTPLNNGETLSQMAAPETGWRYAFRQMQPVLITFALCLTAIICVWIAFGRAPANSGPRFQTIDFEDEDGKTLLKFDRESGRAWRLAKMRVPVRARKADGSTGPQLVAGWEEIAPSFEQGVQDTWHRMGAPTPPP